MIQKLIFGVLATIALVAIGVASVPYYHQYKQTHPDTPMVSRQVADKTVTDVKLAADGEYKALQAKYNSAVVECQKGAQAYALLAPITKNKVPAPVCPAPVQ
jgi:hypothetical protein